MADHRFPSAFAALLLLPAIWLASAGLWAQQAALEEIPPETPYICPMDRDVRGKPGDRCPRCGMSLRPHVPGFREYDLRLTAAPAAIQPGQPVDLTFEVLDPDTGSRVTAFDLVHDRLFHLLAVSHDLTFFAHEHPELGEDGLFRLRIVFPEPGAYRLLCDFFPSGATPQMLVKTLITTGFRRSLEAALPRLTPDLEPKPAENLRVTLRTEPPQPLAGQKTLLFFELDPADELEPFLGAWGHMLAVSGDLVDLMHAHPAIADGGPVVQFNLIFPRPSYYRMWVQFQRAGVVNTVSFTVPVRRLE